jgi:hypothetical protein
LGGVLAAKSRSVNWPLLQVALAAGLPSTAKVTVAPSVAHPAVWLLDTTSRVYVESAFTVVWPQMVPPIVAVTVAPAGAGAPFMVTFPWKRSLGVGAVLAARSSHDFPPLVQVPLPAGLPSTVKLTVAPSVPHPALCPLDTTSTT